MKYSFQDTQSKNATVEMESGDQLVVAFKDKAGEYQVINITVHGAVGVFTHEQTQNAMVVRRNSTQYVEGK